MAEAKTTTAQPQLPEKIRAGMGDVVARTVEVWSDADHARATGLRSILSPDGRVSGGEVPRLAADEWRRVHRSMRLMRLLDDRMGELVRAGRIGGYVESRGQEAATIAPVAALEGDDWIVPAHREAGAALHRGLALGSYVAQLLGTGRDPGKGRLPASHAATPRALRVLPVTACSATQLPQATGLAWAAKIKRDRTVVLAFLGEGATSAEDFHTGVNFAAVFRVPVVFVCVNNGWATSTPARAQTGSETFAVKALAYGIPGVRVDGNDVFATYAATREAVDRARAGGGPTLIEAVTYRMGPPSGAADERRTQEDPDLAAWAARDPLTRFEAWLTATGVLDVEARRRLDEELNEQIGAAVAAEDAAPPQPLRALIEDVYVRPPASLEDQLAELERVRSGRQGAR